MPTGQWSDGTKAWWTTWATSEQAANFTPTAWLRLSMLMALVEEFYQVPNRHLMAEIRMNESKLGSTPEDLARLGWKIGARKDHGPTDEELEAMYPDEEVET
jgi:hypothetical protein